MKVMICGSRNIHDIKILESIIQRNNIQIDHIISGGASGVDRLAEIYAKNNQITITIVYAKWDKYGKRAGFIRNEEMIKMSDFVIAIWDGVSRGTKSSIDLAKKYNKNIIVYDMIDEMLE